MYLAGILALWALLHLPVSGGVGSARSPLAIGDAHSIRQQASDQEPTKPESPSEPSQSQTPSTPSQPQNPQEPTQTQEQPQTPAVNPPTTVTPEKRPASAQKPSPTGKRPKKKASAPTDGTEQKRKVVHHGGTNEPITVLAPGMTDEQAARQRAVTNQLLASTDASLQRLSTRTLNRDQQDTVTQIRKFMEQVKAAEAAGDLQRAYKLAVKAHLLADALEKS